jgi:hypothetical protein
MKNPQARPPAARTATGGTTTTGRSAICSSRCETLPSPARIPRRPLDPTTISRASCRLAPSASARGGAPSASSASIVTSPISLETMPSGLSALSRLAEPLDLSLRSHG